MNAGTWIALGWLVIASGFLRWLYSQTTPEPPDGVTITHDSTWGWSYRIGDRPIDLYSSGYLTRASAIRAARQEVDRLAQKDATTQ